MKKEMRKLKNDIDDLLEDIKSLKDYYYSIPKGVSISEYIPTEIGYWHNEKIIKE